MDSQNKNFTKIGSFSVNDKTPQLALSIIFLLIAGVGAGIIFLTKAYKNNTVPVWIIILSVIGFIVVHELIHIIFMSIFSKGKINVSVKFPTIAVGSDAYFNKSQYIIIALAPVVILGIMCSVGLLLLSYKFLFALLLALNFATATGDYILTFYALKQKTNTYFVDKAEKTLLYLRCERSINENYNS